MSTQWLPGDRTERWLFVGLLVLAAVLRLWNLPHLPFAHDELSALLRLYPSLGQTIHGGVMIGDTHPPGVQVFLWCWTNLFGTSEVAVKLPFIVLSVAALFFWHRVTSAWAGVRAALLITALLATAQYTVMYGQLARPYAFGFFSVGLMADQLARFVAHGRRMNLAGFAIGALLSAYAHHFALLTAALLALGGLWLMPKENRRPYLVVCGASALLYAPNVIITSHQLGMGGLSSWLHAPGPAWVPEYISWVFMFSLPLMLGVGVLVAWSFFKLVRTKGFGQRQFWIALAVGTTPLLVGYAYSVLRAPVLQYSVLIFSFPFLLIALFMGLRTLPKGVAVSGSVLLAGLSVFTLVHDRQHYTLFYNSRYEAYAHAMADAGPKDLVIIDAQPAILQRYLDHWGKRPGASVLAWSELDSLPALAALLERSEFTSATIGFAPNSPPELLALVQEHFPVQEGVQHFCEGSLYRFAKVAGPEPVQWPALKVWSDSTVVEYPVIVEAELGTECADPSALFEVRAVLPPGASGTVSLNVDLYEGDKHLAWLGTSPRTAVHLPDSSRLLFLSFRASDHEAWARNLRARIYVGNPTGRWFGTPGLSFRCRPGNPVLYGLYAPVPGTR